MAEITIIPAKNHADEIVRTAAYARVSSDSEDQLNSFAAQIRYYTELLRNSTDAVFVDMYADQGITGTSAAKRTEFQRLMSDCRKGKIDRILTKSISRFARNTKDSLEAVRELKTLGISVYFEKENIDTGEISSEMMLAIYSQFAQEESISISRNCRMGVQKRMADGTYRTSSAPFGYDYADGRLQINPEKAKIVNGELPMYLVKNHHEPIISRADFNRVQEEMARRSAKRVIADKLTKTEQGKYSAKYALSELLICGECGEHYRRVTWTAKGFKEIKWRCVSRIQYGKKKCHNSPTVDEQALHKAIVSAVNEFCEVKDDVAKTLRESITEVLDPNQNGIVQAAQQRIDELAHNIDELIRLATVPETAESAMSDIAKFSEEMKMLREFIENEKAKQAAAQRGSDELNTILERLEKEDFTLTEYDDVVVRQLIEKITVESKDIITIRFRGGFEIRKELDIGN